MRILAVTQILKLLEHQCQGGRKELVIGRMLRREVGGHHGVVARSVSEGLGGESCAGGGGARACVRGELLQQPRVVARIDHYQDRCVVLGCGAQHRGSADVDVLDGLRVTAARSADRGGEWVEVHDQQVDRQDAVLRHDHIIDAAATEQSTVNLRVQRLDAAVHDLGKAGVTGNLAHGHAVPREELSRSAGGEDLDAAGGELARQLEHAGLVGDGKQRPAHWQRHETHPSQNA